MSKKIDLKIKKEWEKLYCDGYSTTYIAKLYNCSNPVVGRWLKKQNLIRSVKESRRLQSKAFSIFKNKIIELYTSGLSIDAVATELKISSGAVFNVLDEKSLTRTPKEASEALIYKLKNYNFFDQIDTEEKAYWLGFLTADGSHYIDNNKRANRISLEISFSDKKHLEKFAGVFDKKIINRGKKQKSGYLSQMVAVTINNKHLSQILYNYGLVPNKSLSPLIAKIIDFIPHNLINHFLRGIFDGDGSIGIYKYNNKLQYRLNFLGQKKLIEKIYQALMIELDITEIKIAARDKIASITWSSRKDIIKLTDWLYNDASIFLERKYKIVKEIKNELQ